MTSLSKHLEYVAYWNKCAGEHAAKVVSEGGWLLHVCPLNGEERRITIEEAARGIPFLSMWVRAGWQYTKTISVWQEQHVKPRGSGWEFVDYCPKTNSTEWKRLDATGEQK